MSKTIDAISPALADFLREQMMFFVATAPLAAQGRINLSPKGLDTLRILDQRTVAYLDLTGSGAETIAHLRENGRIVLMFCALAGPPRIVRLHGRGTAFMLGSEEFERLASEFPALPGARAIVRVDCDRISESCGFGVPRCEFVEQQTALTNWAEKKGPAALADYRRQKNARSIDDLPAID